VPTEQQTTAAAKKSPTANFLASFDIPSPVIEFSQQDLEQRLKPILASSPLDTSAFLLLYKKLEEEQQQKQKTQATWMQQLPKAEQRLTNSNPITATRQRSISVGDSSKQTLPSTPPAEPLPSPPSAPPVPTSAAAPPPTAVPPTFVADHELEALLLEPPFSQQENPSDLIELVRLCEQATPLMLSNSRSTVTVQQLIDKYKSPNLAGLIRQYT